MRLWHIRSEQNYFVWLDAIDNISNHRLDHRVKILHRLDLFQMLINYEHNISSLRRHCLHTYIIVEISPSSHISVLFPILWILLRASSNFRLMPSGALSPLPPGAPKLLLLPPFKSCARFVKQFCAKNCTATADERNRRMRGRPPMTSVDS